MSSDPAYLMAALRPLPLPAAQRAAACGGLADAVKVRRGGSQARGTQTADHRPAASLWKAQHPVLSLTQMLSEVCLLVRGFVQAATCWKALAPASPQALASGP